MKRWILVVLSLSSHDCAHFQTLALIIHSRVTSGILNSLRMVMDVFNFIYSYAMHANTSVSVDWAIIGSGNGLVPVRHQPIT